MDERHVCIRKGMRQKLCTEPFRKVNVKSGQVTKPMDLKLLRELKLGMFGMRFAVVVIFLLLRLWST